MTTTTNDVFLAVQADWEWLDVDTDFFALHDRVVGRMLWNDDRPPCHLDQWRPCDNYLCSESGIFTHALGLYAVDEPYVNRMGRRLDAGPVWEFSDVPFLVLQLLLVPYPKRRLKRRHSEPEFVDTVHIMRRRDIG